MKKIGQKLSFLTKILLVVGLLISNLSSLSVVFAYEATTDLVIELVDEALEINYTEALAEEVESVNVKVYENYTYLDGLSEEEVVNVYSLTAEEVLAAKEGNLELTYNSIFNSEDENVYNFELFDGTYSARVELVDTTVYPEETVVETEGEVATDLEVTPVVEEDTLEEVLETVIVVNTYEKEISYESGLNIKVFDLNGNEITMVDGVYPVTVDNSSVKVVAQVLSGGLRPTDVYLYNGEEYLASDLLAYEFSSTKDFNGYLFGEYELPVEVSFSRVTEESSEEVVYNDSINVLYESYEMNATRLNELSNSLGYGSYLFYSEAKDGILYVIPTLSEEEVVTSNVATKTMLDLYNVLNNFVSVEENEEQVINYTLFKNGVNVLESYDESTGVTFEEHLSSIMLDDTVEVILSNEGLTVTFNAVVVADFNNDDVVNTDDVLELINQVVGESEVTDLDKSNLYGEDEEVNTLDVLYLNQVVKTKAWYVEVVNEEVTLNASLGVKFNDEELSEENYLTSGDEFTVDYILSLSDYAVNGVAGLFNYDETLFELVSVEVSNEGWIGNSKDGKFLYLGEESLTGPVEETTEPEDTTTDNTSEVEAVLEEETVDYVVVTATFKALKATEEGVITLDEIELFNSTENGVTYYVLDNNTVSTDNVSVVASEDNTLQYLEVAGVEITLEEEVYEYEITVPSDVTAVDLKYILNNVSANVTSVVAPEELVEGENTIVLTVTSESGVSQDYTITVIREEVKEETVTQVYYDNNYADDENNQKEEVIVTEPEEEEEEEPKEESNLSRIVIIILILLVIAGLVYLIFKDEDDEETKKANKEVNRLKKESIEPEVIKSNNKPVNKNSNKKTGNKNSNSKNKKKER